MSMKPPSNSAVLVKLVANALVAPATPFTYDVTEPDVRTNAICCQVLTVNVGVTAYCVALLATIHNWAPFELFVLINGFVLSPELTDLLSSTFLLVPLRSVG